MAKDDLRPDMETGRARMRSTLGSGKEIKAARWAPVGDEHVDRMTKGTYGRGTGLLVLTDRRLLFLKEGMTKKTEDFPLEKGLIGAVVVRDRSWHHHDLRIGQQGGDQEREQG